MKYLLPALSVVALLSLLAVIQLTDVRNVAMSRVQTYVSSYSKSLPVPQSENEAPVAAASTSVTVLSDNSQVQVQILGQSGKMVIRPKSANNDLSDIVVTMDYIRELNANGVIVGSAGKSNAKKHSRETFANTAFTFSAVRSIRDGNGVEIAVGVDFFVTLITSARLNVTTMVFVRDGSITLGSGETFTFSRGSMKFNIQLKDWPFCGLAGSSNADTICATGEVGTVVEVGLSAMLKNTSARILPVQPDVTTGGLQFWFGPSITVDLSKQVQLNNVWTPLAAPYPRVTFNQTTVTAYLAVGFPIFANTAFYDPIISYDNLPSPPPAASPSPSRSRGAVAPSGSACGQRAKKAACTANNQCKSCVCKNKKCA